VAREKIGKGLIFIALNAEAEVQVARLEALREEFVVDDLDGNQLFFNYPNESASSQAVGDEREAI
jgi:hypothetical protein